MCRDKIRRGDVNVTSAQDPKTEERHLQSGFGTRPVMPSSLLPFPRFAHARLDGRAPKVHAKWLTKAQAPLPGTMSCSIRKEQRQDKEGMEFDYKVTHSHSSSQLLESYLRVTTLTHPRKSSYYSSSFLHCFATNSSSFA